MSDVYLGLGSNLGDRHANLRAAIDAIAELPLTTVINASPIYDTPPMGPQDQGAYLNMAVQIQTRIEPTELVVHLQSIEQDLGRARPENRRHWGPREIDIDVLLYADHIIEEPGLTVPHPGMHERWFVLKPLADIAPDVMHPTLGRTVAGLLRGVQAVETPEAKR